MAWIDQARSRDQYLGRIAYDGGAQVDRSIDLRNVGYLDRLTLVHPLTGQYGTAGPTAVDAFGNLAGAIKWITLRANAVGNIFNVSGSAAAVISAIDSAYKRNPLGVNPSPGTVTASPGTSAFADKWAMDIPIAVDFANKYSPMGFFQTALNAQETSLIVLWNPVNATVGVPGSGVYVPGNSATGPAGVGYLDVQQQYFDPIADPASQPIMGFIHRWREFPWPLTADGDVEIKLDPANYYLRILVVPVTGAAGALAPDSTHLTRLKLVYGGNFPPFDQITDAKQLVNAEKLGFQLPAGWYLWDFITDSHTERDVINAAATTNLRLVLTLSGATYSGGAYAKVIIEEMVPLVMPAAGTAGVQGAAA